MSIDNHIEFTDNGINVNGQPINGTILADPTVAAGQHNNINTITITLPWTTLTDHRSTHTGQ